MTNVVSADLVRYNANSRGTYTGDCTARAISLAFNMDYSKARKALNDTAKSSGSKSYKTVTNVYDTIKALGGGEPYVVDERITVNDWVDQHSSGTYIILCNDNGVWKGPGNHLVCAIDGKVYDSWNSLTRYVLRYFVIDSGIHGSDITDISSWLEDWMRDKTSEEFTNYFNEVFSNIVDKNRKLKKLADLYDVNINLTLEITRLALSNYTITFACIVTLGISEYDYAEDFKHKFAITFKPTMQVEELVPYFEETFYSKFYTFIQSIVRKAEDICNGQEMLSGVETPGKYRYWMSREEKKSFNSLPYWVQKLTTYFNISRDYYGDKGIELTLTMPPFDTDYGTSTKQERTFDSFSMTDLRKGIDVYKNTGDYDYAYEVARGV